MVIVARRRLSLGVWLFVDGVTTPLASWPARAASESCRRRWRPAGVRGRRIGFGGFGWGGQWAKEVLGMGAGRRYGPRARLEVDFARAAACRWLAARCGWFRCCVGRADARPRGGVPRSRPGSPVNLFVWRRHHGAAPCYSASPAMSCRGDGPLATTFRSQRANVEKTLTLRKQCNSPSVKTKISRL